MAKVSSPRKFLTRLRWEKVLRRAARPYIPWLLDPPPEPKAPYVQAVGQAFHAMPLGGCEPPKEKKEKKKKKERLVDWLAWKR